MTPIDTRIESVTLYHRGATVRRVAALDFSAGAPASLVVAGLPLALIDHTVRARVEAEAGHVVTSLVRVGLSAQPRGTPEAPPDQQALDAVVSKLERARARRHQLEAELAQLSQLSVNARPSPEEGKPPAPSPMFARASLEAMLEEASGARVALLRTLRTEEKALADEEATLRQRLARASTAAHVRPDELSKSVTVQVVPGATATRGTLVLEYFVVGARWAPAYQCRMSRDCRSADLQLRGVVAQRTGEDWRGVRLKLSTASPVSWTELPELSSVRIGRAQPPPPAKRGFRPPPQGATSLFGDHDRGLERARAQRPVIPAWQPPMVDPMVIAAHPATASAAAGATLGASALRDELDDEVVVRRAAMEREEAPAKEARRMMAPPPAPLTSPAPAGPPARPQARMAKVASSRMEAVLREEADEGGFDEQPSLGPPDVVAYGALRLSGPGERTRGQLIPVDRRRAYLESLSAQQRSAPFDVLAVVEAAERLGHEVVSMQAPSGTADVRSEAGWYDYVYATDAAVDVPSDGTFHSVPVQTRTATGDVRYVTVPREDPQVYRQAQVRNPLPSPLLPGPVEVYVAGEYVLTTTLPSVPPGGDFKLSLGVEQAVKVARNTTFREERSGDKVVATNELIHDVAIELVSHLDREATFEVRERIPQPAPDAEVVVDEGKVTPKWEAYTQEERGQVLEGGRRWVLTVKPHGSQTLSAQYKVKLYANNELVGGNRREV
ncbi:MAG: DUF4139 domain-containing protein [Myxococcaceae bacterium]|nr:DUF4139 domain-containing protein [Myxococcaceae bacterium]